MKCLGCDTPIPSGSDHCSMCGAIAPKEPSPPTVPTQVNQASPRSKLPAPSKDQLICVNCGTISKPILKTKGSFIIELCLWLFFIVPGLFYSLWRLTSKYKACPNCNAPNMIPADSPIAHKILE
jgi:hypothetical protein